MSDNLELLIGELKGQLHAIDKAQRDSWESRRKVYDELGQIKSSIDKLERDISSVCQSIKNDIKPITDDYKRNKQRGLGILTGVAIASGGLAFGFQKLFALWK